MNKKFIALSFSALIALSACGSHSSENAVGNTPLLSSTTSATATASATPSTKTLEPSAQATETASTEATVEAPQAPIEEPPTETPTEEAVAEAPAPTSDAVSEPAPVVAEQPATVTEQVPVVEDTQSTVTTSNEQATAPATAQAPAPQFIDQIPRESQDIPTTQAPAPVVGGTTVASEQTVTLTTVSGNGSIPVTISRDPASAAPNIPTYVSAICDGQSVGSLSANANSEVYNSSISFSGNNCKIIASVKNPSSKWAGTYNASIIGLGTPTYRNGTSSVVEAGWVSQAVAGTSNFTLATATGFQGAVDLKLTACSSDGGTSDSTASHACAGLVQKNVGSTAVITLSDSAGVLTTQTVTISADRHHASAHFDLPRATTGAITITVSSTNGSAILVHGPGSRAVGTL